MGRGIPIRRSSVEMISSFYFIFSMAFGRCAINDYLLTYLLNVTCQQMQVGRFLFSIVSRNENCETASGES